MSEFCKDCLEKQKRIEALEAALRPFIAINEKANYYLGSITWNDIERARKALKGGKG